MGLWVRMDMDNIEYVSVSNLDKDEIHHLLQHKMNKVLVNPWHKRLLQEAKYRF